MTATRSESPPCQHCGLPVAAGQGEFCCLGCKAAHRMIAACGLSDYYALKEDSQPLDNDSLSYLEFDAAAFEERFVTQHSPTQSHVTLGLEGLHCAACIWLLERIPRLLTGVLSARVRWADSTLEVRWDPTVVRLSQVASTLSSLGYRVHPLAPELRHDAHREEQRKTLIRLAVAAAAAGNNMVIAIALYLGMFSTMSAPIEALLRWASCGVGLVSLLGPGRVFFVGALAALRTRTPHMDLPVALGLGVGTLAGLVNTVRGSGEIYFDTLSVLVLLLLLGRFVQGRQQRTSARAVELLSRLTPRVLHKVDGAQVRDVPGEVAEVGDRFRVLPGEAVPGDGVVVAGASRVDLSVLTGESTPSPLEIGDAVFAGTVNLSSAVEVRLDHVGADTRIGRMMDDARSARRPALVALADRIGGWFVSVVIGLAGLTLIAWWGAGPIAAIDHTVALLIVACPCALGLATPLTLAVALGRASKRKILIKHADALQRVARSGMVWLDKTGTLTEGTVAVVSWLGDDKWQRFVASLERDSAHPVGQALAALEEDAPLAGAGAPTQYDGGLEGRVAGHLVSAGNAMFIAQHADDVPLRMQKAARECLRDRLSPVYVAVDGEVVAVAGVGDAVRGDAKQAIDGLRSRGWNVGILSGDHPVIVHAVAQQLGLDPAVCHGGLMPEDKVAFVESAAKAGEVIMVGDGANDSAALAAATVGVATKNGVEVSLAAADVYLARPGVAPLLELLEAGSGTMRAVRRNFVVSLGYNAFAVGLAATGHISPLVAAILMPISSLTVVALSLSTRVHGGRK